MGLAAAVAIVLQQSRLCALASRQHMPRGRPVSPVIRTMGRNEKNLRKATGETASSAVVQSETTASGTSFRQYELPFRSVIMKQALLFHNMGPGLTLLDVSSDLRRQGL